MEEKPVIEDPEKLDSTTPGKVTSEPENGSTTNTENPDILNTDSTLDSLVIPMGNEVVVSCTETVATPEKDYTKGISLSDDNHGVASSQPNDNLENISTSVAANDGVTDLTNNFKKCESASTITSESTVCSIEDNAVPDPPLDAAIKQEQEVPAVTFGLDEV